MNNPVQIILNTQHFVENVDPLASPRNGKDFFEGRDEEFIEHKAHLNQSLEQLLALNSNPSQDLIYATVELQNEGWAKSHRPVEKLFSNRNTQSLVSGNELGSLIVGLANKNILKIQEQIKLAPEETEWVYEDGKKKSKASSLRSETGVIKSIAVYSAEDRRKFSAAQAMEWLSNPLTGHAYYIETFLPVDEDQSSLPSKVLRNLVNQLTSLNQALEVSIVNEEWLQSTFIIIRLTDPSTLSNANSHQRILSLLEKTSIVRSIHLPPIPQTTIFQHDKKGAVVLPAPDSNRKYPIVGIIDTGVSLNGGLADWCAGDIDFLDASQQDLSHGTFIAGLISGAKTLNSAPELDENECQFFDMNLYPTIEDDFHDYYPRGFIDLLEQIKDSIQEAINNGVRVFNMSLSLKSCIEDDQYGIFAHIIDYISEKHDVIFVLPAGNLNKYVRDAWPDEENDCLKLLAEYRYSGRDKIYQPAESVHSITVGALDPMCESGYLKPARYTRRGPGPSLGHKPDVCHIGGKYDKPHNLASISTSGELIESAGTSFASPLVAKTLANLDFAITDKVTKETLKALLIHNSELPNWFSKKNLKNIAKDFVGAGVPKNAASTLTINSHEITMVFQGKISSRQELRFDFQWPKSLVTAEGKCKGHVKITTVYSPKIDRRNGSEFIIHNLDTWLRQVHAHDPITDEPKFKSMLTAEQNNTSVEKERIANGSKWWPIKKIEQTIPKGRGSSSQCRLVIESLSRQGYTIESPIPFTVILTISDPSQTADIFNEVRSQLQANGVKLADIRSNIRTQLRN